MEYIIVNTHKPKHSADLRQHVMARDYRNTALAVMNLLQQQQANSA